ncbi:hypothetical protein N665_0003s0029 [Sinapis alba]|nr:hypothetical protein N665_0003s0029 [Sinapis alba]
MNYFPSLADTKGKKIFKIIFLLHVGLSQGLLHCHSSTWLISLNPSSITRNSWLKQTRSLVLFKKSKLAQFKNGTYLLEASGNSEDLESKENEETTTKNESDFVRGLRSYWSRLNADKRRNFIKKVLASTRKDKRWRLCVSMALAQRISESWGFMISDGGWEPLGILVVVKMIKTRLHDMKAFVYENGWSKYFSLAADEEHRKLLQEIQFLLVTFCDLKDLVVSYFEKLQVSKRSLTECGLVDTPQSICFWKCHELNQFLDLLKRIKCERDDGTDLVCRAMDSFYNDMNPNAHYAKANAGSDDIIFWLTEKSSGDEKFQFPRPIRAHNLHVWVAVLGAVHFTCRTMGTQYYTKKFRVGDSTEVFKHIMTYSSNFVTKRLYCSAVVDVLKGELHPKFGLPDTLKSVMTNKVPLIDSNIFMTENSRINLLNHLVILSVFDYRSFILPPLKEFLMEGIVDMECKAKLAAVQADRLLEEEMNSQTSTSMPRIFDQNVEHVPSPSPKLREEDSMEHGQEEDAKDMQNMPGEESMWKHLEPAHAEVPTIYNSALAMTLKILKEYLVKNLPCAIGNFFTVFVSKQMKEGVYSCLLSDLLASIEEVYSMTSYAAELLVFILENIKRMSCKRCRQEPKYPEQSSYGFVMAADSIRDLKIKCYCDNKTGGCGKENFVHHIISRCPPIFTIMLEWEKDETEKEISETRKALEWEIDMSRLYGGLEPSTKYQLVSMVNPETGSQMFCPIISSVFFCYNMEMYACGCGEEENHYVCLAYKKNRWVSFSHGASAKEVVGDWKSVVRFCGERKGR